LPQESISKAGGYIFETVALLLNPFPYRRNTHERPSRVIHIDMQGQAVIGGASSLARTDGSTGIRFICELTLPPSECRKGIFNLFVLLREFGMKRHFYSESRNLFPSFIGCQVKTKQPAEHLA